MIIMNIIEVGKIYKTLHGEFKVLEFINKDKHYQNYYVLHNNERKILKYIPNKNSQEPCFYVSRIKTLLTMKLDSSYFIKPCDLIEFDELSYGYILDIVDDSYCKLCDFQFLETKFSSLEVLLDACLNITKAFRYIHKRFNMYFQIFDENNFYINPENGDIKIVVEDYTFKMGTNNDLMGRERFSAPEIVTYEDQERNGNTDSYLLSLLIFLLIVNHHPFE